MGFLWLINGGDPNQLLTGTILQVKQFFQGKSKKIRAFLFLN